MHKKQIGLFIWYITFEIERSPLCVKSFILVGVCIYFMHNLQTMEEKRREKKANACKGPTEPIIGMPMAHFLTSA